MKNIYTYISVAVVMLVMMVASAFLLTAGFCFWGVNILNLWFGFLGVLLYCLVKRENPANQINAMVFTTGICPLFTDLMIRYPHADVVGFRWQGILLLAIYAAFCTFQFLL